MLDKFFLEDYIKKNNMPDKPRGVLREYLQTEILAALYGSKYGPYLTFMGGTCLKFVYQLERFSEDLDFELIKKGLEYDELAAYLEKELGRLGFVVDTRVKKTPNIVIIFIKFSEVMQQVGLSNYAGQKLKIKFEIDPRPSPKIAYESRRIAAYGKFFSLIANTLPTIYAQKIIAVANRPYQKGRDFYDLIWFLAQKNLEPNYKLLQEKNIQARNRKEALAALKKFIARSDLKQAAREVRPFLYHPEQARWILDFKKYL